MPELSMQKRKSPFLAFFILFQLLFSIFIIISILNIQQNDKTIDENNGPKITISDIYSKLKDFPDEAIGDIEASLVKAIELNSSDIDIPDSSAVIRDESIKIHSFSNNGFNSLSMIVDIPNIEQSYQIFYKYPTVGAENPDQAYYENPRAILCLEDKSKIIYKNFKCKDNYPSNVRDRILSDYIKFYFFDYFSVYFDFENPETITIRPSVTYNNDETTKSKYIEEVKAAVDSLGLSPDTYKYYVRTADDVDYYNPD